jgi:hypothetical protein
MSRLITFDERGRAPLKQYGGKPGGDYIVAVMPDGTIQLTPAVVMTAAEAAMWQGNPAVAAFLATDDSADEYAEVDLETGDAAGDDG